MTTEAKPVTQPGGVAGFLQTRTANIAFGIGNLKGAVLGGFIIGIIQQMCDNRGDLGPVQFGPAWTNLYVFAILILVMVFKPSGLLGEETREAG